MIHVFLVGSKGIPAKYGGYETFVENLTARKTSSDISYHVSCMNSDERHFIYNNTDCFNIRVPLPGAAGRIFHVSLVLSKIERWCKRHHGESVIVYILGCRIGPLLIPHARRLHKLGVMILSNPDGLEWKRDKWNAAEKKFLLYCESCLVRHSDLVICDSESIQQYVLAKYGCRVKLTIFIAYGADIKRSECHDADIQQWYDKFVINVDNYYLVVGRFVPENNYETIIREFMRSNTKRDLVIITNVENNDFYKQLIAKTVFERDKRIKFVGTVYDVELLKKIRENAYGYLHGHEVGGTNPSLLEALASTKINLLYDVGFNCEVAGKSALYWRKEDGDLAHLIEDVDALIESEIKQFDVASTQCIMDKYSWGQICDKYVQLFHMTSAVDKVTALSSISRARSAM